MKKSKFQYLIEQQDNIKGLGYDYRGKFFQNTLSTYIFFNEKLQPLILKLDEFMVEMVKGIKQIKKHRNYTIRKDNNNFN